MEKEVHGVETNLGVQNGTGIWTHWCMHAKSLQSCPTLCDPMDSGPPDSSVHRVFQARILEWVAISFFRGSS